MARPSAKNPALAGAITIASMPRPAPPATKPKIVNSWRFNHSKVCCLSSSKSLPNRCLKASLSVGKPSPITMQSGSRRRM